MKSNACSHGSSAVLVMILVLLADSAVMKCAWAFEVPVHSALTRRTMTLLAPTIRAAALNFGFGNSPGASPSNCATRDDYASPLNKEGCELLEIGAASQGAKDEDLVPSVANVIHHFHQPVLDQGLLAPLSSAAWAQRNGNDHSWAEARRFLRAAIVAHDPLDRRRAYREAFYSLGRIMHLVQDLASPAHARDDVHLCLDEVIDGVYCEHPLDHEGTFTTTSVAMIKSMFPASLVEARELLRFDPWLGLDEPIANLWDTQTLQPSFLCSALPSLVGLAEFTNAAFFSDDTVDFAFPDDLDPDESELPCPNPRHLSCINRLCSGPSIPGKPIVAIGAKGVPTVVHTEVAKTHQDVLLPKALGYSQALAEYFLRGAGKLELCPTDSDGVMVRNLSAEALDGGELFILDGERKLPLFEPTVYLAPRGQPGAEFNFFGLKWSSLLADARAVYFGPFGKEQDGVVTWAKRDRAMIAPSFEVRGRDRSDSMGEDHLGKRLWLGSDTLAIAAPQDGVHALSPEETRSENGAVYLFERGGAGSADPTGLWSKPTVLAPRGLPGHHTQFFDIALDASEHRLAVRGGSYSSSSTDERYGTIHIYDRDNPGSWRNVATITDNGDAWYGESRIWLTEDGNQIFVHSVKDPTHRLTTQSIDIYSQSDVGSWYKSQSIDKPYNSLDEFGTFGYGGGRLVITSPLFNGTGRAFGDLRVYARAGEQWVIEDVINSPQGILGVQCEWSEVVSAPDTIGAGYSCYEPGIKCVRSGVMIFEKLEHWTRTADVALPPSTSCSFVSGQEWGRLAISPSGHEISIISLEYSRGSSQGFLTSIGERCGAWQQVSRSPLGEGVNFGPTVAASNQAVAVGHGAPPYGRGLVRIFPSSQ